MGHSIEFMRWCVHTWLEDIRLHWLEIESLEDEIRSLRDRLDGLNSMARERVSSSRASDYLADGINRLDELADEWQGKVNLYTKEFSNALILCDQSRETKVVWMHVVERKTWSYIGKHAGYSETQIKRIGNKGIALLYELMPGDYRGNSIPGAI